mgnify:CR=1 FL=1
MVASVRADPAKLLDVDVDQFAWAGTPVAADRFSLIGDRTVQITLLVPLVNRFWSSRELRPRRVTRHAVSERRAIRACLADKQCGSQW